jgi:hypothetical protein
MPLAVRRLGSAGSFREQSVENPQQQHESADQRGIQKVQVVKWTKVENPLGSSKIS